jgi:hypothetical protein
VAAFLVSKGLGAVAPTLESHEVDGKKLLRLMAWQHGHQEYRNRKTLLVEIAALAALVSKPEPKVKTLFVLSRKVNKAPKTDTPGFPPTAGARASAAPPLQYATAQTTAVRLCYPVLDVGDPVLNTAAYADKCVVAGELMAVTVMGAPKKGATPPPTTKENSRARASGASVPEALSNLRTMAGAYDVLRRRLGLLPGQLLIPAQIEVPEGSAIWGLDRQLEEEWCGRLLAWPGYSAYENTTQELIAEIQLANTRRVFKAQWMDLVEKIPAISVLLSAVCTAANDAVGVEVAANRSSSSHADKGELLWVVVWVASR